ncbi:hypothetical protein BD311DRAFT_770545 [Dichomitus squalens]|uniref:Uncharacterized protein n=1 Tax=Dichomitus squalens TaxID=114155 RepID=A0A4Q9M5Z2_9APHY|nr:hypothetical protein BD311DRAFT_770545 [Dichomitus squalens]
MEHVLQNIYSRMSHPSPPDPETWGYAPVCTNAVPCMTKYSGCDDLIIQRARGGS